MDAVKWRVDTSALDRAISGINANWKPPVDVKKIIVSELGAILALTAEDTRMIGPKGKKNTTYRSAYAYVKRRYEPWKVFKGKGRRPKGRQDSLMGVKIRGKLYFKMQRYPNATWAMINKFLRRRQKEVLKSTGSSKAAWMWMFFQAAKAAGLPARVPKSWKNRKETMGAMYHMKRKGKWSRATTSKIKKVPANGEFVMRLYSEAHNTLNKGVRGTWAFTTRLNAREAYMKKVLGKKCQATMKKMAKKYPGLEVLS